MLALLLKTTWLLLRMGLRASVACLTTPVALVLGLAQIIGYSFHTFACDARCRKPPGFSFRQCLGALGLLLLFCFCPTAIAIDEAHYTQPISPWEDAVWVADHAPRLHDNYALPGPSTLPTECVLRRDHGSGHLFPRCDAVPLGPTVRVAPRIWSVLSISQQYACASRPFFWCISLFLLAVVVCQCWWLYFTAWKKVCDTFWAVSGWFGA